MSNLQSGERIRQMSKQEEILLKRKLEIEKKLKGQKPKPVSENKSQSSSRERISSTSNKFSKDAETNESGRYVSKSELSPQSSSSQSEVTSSNYEDIETKPEMDPDDNKKPENQQDASQSDWFQDALKRAKEKAKEIAASAPSIPDTENDESKKRKSRWSDKSSQQNHHKTAMGPSVSALPAQVGISQQTNFNMPTSIVNMVGEGQHMEAIQGIMISKLTRNNPAIISYALKVFGSLDLTDAQWKQCEEQMKMNIVFQLLQEKKKEAARLELQGKVKFEYDSDEDVDGGTWEHKRRKKEMEITARKAEELTRGAEGKHHIGDFLPPEELASFMEKYTALKEGRDPDLSDYRENKLTEDNVGYRMLKSMGWTEGTGLGAEGKGITNPVNQKGKSEKQGLGAGAVNNLSVEDDEYDAYRKRMMLAYRFRPNPLNNPRRAYY
ncbi:SURP and G-patch domain-containing protein 1 [Armadillidium nasatum]|uniref:SURP and G-patch domain-containing protein 1 n=1 Tax=Armadillidium nasatum TaxID=96803 RepID=A0A5N5SLF9_9CRUS|nr:SURP and G-patch domain-containing protein 1 [Armadillidium nasatum]